jgi:TolA-binding protein
MEMLSYLRNTPTWGKSSATAVWLILAILLLLPKGADTVRPVVAAESARQQSFEEQLETARRQYEEQLVTLQKQHREEMDAIKKDAKETREQLESLRRQHQEQLTQELNTLRLSLTRFRKEVYRDMGELIHKQDASGDELAKVPKGRAVPRKELEVTRGAEGKLVVTEPVDPRFDRAMYWAQDKQNCLGGILDLNQAGGKKGVILFLPNALKKKIEHIKDNALPFDWAKAD